MSAATPGDDEKARSSGAYWDRVAAEGAGDARYWLGVLSVRRWVNRRMTGDEENLYILRGRTRTVLIRPCWRIREFVLSTVLGLER